MEEKEKPKVDFSLGVKIINAVRTREKETGSKYGAIPCPDCGKAVTYGIASNGHIRARCEGCGFGLIM